MANNVLKKDENLPLYVATVKWFDTSKGFGFGVVDHDNRDVFIHHSTIDPDSDGFKNLTEGDTVELSYVVTDEDKLRAIEVFTQ